ncbi:mitochondrial RNA binding protein 1 [Leishmania tarentolae]|uniref:Mitochondrial RNA binding protein 1 n=1 Tax=Leishmania tarentolae TaxID=5689 RepID=A0A640KQK1_LEITA|nr:mitochondrial RNA binding protein 1 [Leishmania tarentolae]
MAPPLRVSPLSPWAGAHTHTHTHTHTAHRGIHRNGFLKGIRCSALLVFSDAVVVTATVLITVLVSVAVLVALDVVALRTIPARQGPLVLGETEALRQRTLQEVLNRHGKLIFEAHRPLFIHLRVASVHLAFQHVAIRRLLKRHVESVVLDVVARDAVLHDADEAGKVNMTETHRDATVPIKLRGCVVRVRLARAELWELRNKQLLAIHRHTGHAPVLRVIAHVVYLKLGQRVCREKAAAVLVALVLVDGRCGGTRLKAHRRGGCRRQRKSCRHRAEHDVCVWCNLSLCWGEEGGDKTYRLGDRLRGTE